MECPDYWLMLAMQFQNLVQLRFSIACLSVLAGLLSGCGKTSPAAAQVSAPGLSKGALVSVMPVTQEQVTPQTVVVGNIIARRTSLVASGADGKVDKFLVRVGQIVEEGQELSVLNMVTTDLEIEEARQLLAEREQAYLALKNGSRPEEISEAAAQLEAARVAMDTAAKKFERTQRLAQTAAANQDALDDALEKAATTRKSFEAQKASYDLIVKGPRTEDVAAALARLDAQHQHVEYLLAEREKRTTRAPFRGIVVAEHTEAGQWLSKNASVVTVSDLLDEVHVVANVDERELPNVILGAQATVTCEATPGREWKGKVVSVVPRTQWEIGSRTVPVKVAVQNEVIENGGVARPVLSEGMYAKVTFRGPSRIATLVPKNGIILSESGSKIFIVLPGETPQTGKAKPIMLVRGGAFGDRVESLSPDVVPGMNVVTEGQERLQPFANVMIVSSASSTSGGGSPVTNHNSKANPAPSDSLSQSGQ